MHFDDLFWLSKFIQIDFCTCSLNWTATELVALKWKSLVTSRSIGWLFIVWMMRHVTEQKHSDPNEIVFTQFEMVESRSSDCPNELKQTAITTWVDGEWSADDKVYDGDEDGLSFIRDRPSGEWISHRFSTCEGASGHKRFAMKLLHATAFVCGFSINLSGRSCIGHYHHQPYHYSHDHHDHLVLYACPPISRYWSLLPTSMRCFHSNLLRHARHHHENNASQSTQSLDFTMSYRPLGRVHIFSNKVRHRSLWFTLNAFDLLLV